MQPDLFPEPETPALTFWQRMGEWMVGGDDPGEEDDRTVPES